jgi:predicted transcriptional regulator
MKIITEESGSIKQTLPSYMVIMDYLNKINQREREAMKSDLLKLRNELYKKNIILPLDFEPYGEQLYSDKFNRDISFLNSAGMIEEKVGSIIYQITDLGRELERERSEWYENISDDTIATFDDILSDLIREIQQ